MREVRVISARKANEAYELDLMQFNALISAIPRQWKLNVSNGVEARGQCLCVYDQVVDKPHLANLVYSSLLRVESLSGKVSAWTNELGCVFNEDYLKKCCRDIYSGYKYTQAT